MLTPDVSISGIGVFVPDTVSIEHAVAQGWYPAEDAELHQLAGAAVAGDLPAPEMALRSALEALKRAGLCADDLDLLLYATSWHQGPDGWQPQYYLQRHLGGAEVLAVEIRHGCNGMFSALDLAAGYLRHDGAAPRHALLVAADNFGTPLLDRWRMGPGYVCGDAASAIVLTTGPGFARLLSVGSAAVPEAEEMHRAGEPLFPPAATLGQPLDFSARNTAFRRQALSGAGGTVALAQIHLRTIQLVERCLDEAGIGLDDITRVAYMNYSREIVEQRCMAALGLPMSRSTWDFGRALGHLGPSDQIVSLEHLVSIGELMPGDHFLMLGVGPGVTISSAVVRIDTPPPWRS